MFEPPRPDVEKGDEQHGEERMALGDPLPFGIVEPEEMRVRGDLRTVDPANDPEGAPVLDRGRVVRHAPAAHDEGDQHVGEIGGRSAGRRQDPFQPVLQLARPEQGQDLRPLAARLSGQKGHERLTHRKGVRGRPSNSFSRRVGAGGESRPVAPPTRREFSSRCRDPPWCRGSRRRSRGCPSRGAGPRYWRS